MKDLIVGAKCLKCNGTGNYHQSPCDNCGGAGILTEISIKRIEKKRRELFAIARENSKKIKEMPLPTSAKVVNNLKNKTF